MDVIVVDLDQPESLAMFWGTAPIGDTTLLRHLDLVGQSLQVD